MMSLCGSLWQYFHQLHTFFFLASVREIFWCLRTICLIASSFEFHNLEPVSGKQNIENGAEMVKKIFCN